MSLEGPSGAGKSTLLNLIALLDSPDTGRVEIEGIDPTTMSARQRAELRSRTFSFVFQSFHLLDNLTVLENVLVGMRYRALPFRVQLRKARASLEAVGLKEREGELARNVSGGQRQRIAIARALATEAPVLVADEPTGNLDSATARDIVQLLAQIAQDGHTVIMVTHSAEVAKAAQRRIHVLDGHIAFDSGNTEPRPITVRARAGRDSVLSISDNWRDAWTSLVSAFRSTCGLLGAVALSVGLVVATIGLGESARAQVSDAFDVARNQQVSATISGEQRDPAAIAHSAAQINGITVQGARTEYQSVTLAYDGDPGPPDASISVVTPSFSRAARLEIAWAEGVTQLEPGHVLVGSVLAEKIQLGPLFAGERLTVNGRPLEVVGIIEESPLDPTILQGVMVATSEPAAENPLVTDIPTSTEIRILTDPGAAQQVAMQLPLAVSPTNPSAVRVVAPPDPRNQRASIEGTVSAVLYALSAVMVFAAVVSLMNAMSMSVVARTREFGLRRALGARPLHLRRLIFAEALLIGAGGGIVGLFFGLMSVLVVSLARGWSPVFEPLLGPLSVLMGILVSVAAGSVAALRAGRVQPVEALRQ